MYRQAGVQLEKKFYYRSSNVVKGGTATARERGVVDSGRAREASQGKRRKDTQLKAERQKHTVDKTRAQTNGMHWNRSSRGRSA